MARKLFILLSIITILGLSSTSALAQTAKKTPLQCGDEIQGEFTTDYQPFYYSLSMSAGDQFQIVGTPVGDQLTFSLTAFTPPPTNRVFASNSNDTNQSNPEKNPSLKSGVLSAKGAYTIVVYNARIYAANLQQVSPGGTGLFSLAVGCTLADGTEIAPGSNKGPSPNPTTNSPAQPANSSFTGYGFPGVGSEDFSKAIEIPLAKGQTQNGALGGTGSDVFTYAYAAKANSTAKLTVTRMGGNLSVGVAVINKADNSIVFLGGLPSSNNLSVDLTFPADGTYTVGIFRLDIAPKQVGTSGAFSVKLE